MQRSLWAFQLRYAKAVLKHLERQVEYERR